MSWWFALTFIVGVVAGAACMFAIAVHAFNGGSP